MDAYNCTADTAFLKNELGKQLYTKTAAACPAVLFSDTLTADDIVADLHASTVTEFFNLSAPDRAPLLRAAGIAEDFITGSASDFEKFSALSACMPQCVGHPIYTELHYLLRRVFDFTLPINMQNCEKIWSFTAKKLSEPDFGLRGALTRTSPAALLLTEHPHAPLSALQILKKEGFPTPVLPVFAPNEVSDPCAAEFITHLHRLEDSEKINITDLASLQAALVSALDRFTEAGCTAAFHTLPPYFSFARPDPYHANDILCRAIKGKPVSPPEASLFQAQLLRFLGESYKARGITMILHLQNNSENVAPGDRHTPNTKLALSALLDYLEDAKKLPRTVLTADRDLGALSDILYSAPLECEKICRFTGEGADATASLLQCEGRRRFGLFYPSVTTLPSLLAELSAHLPLGTLSFCLLRSEARGAAALSSLFMPDIFHRLLCTRLGELAAQGDAPLDLDTASDLVRRISFQNTKEIFSL